MELFTLKKLFSATTAGIVVAAGLLPGFLASAQVATGAFADAEYRLAHEYGVRVGMTTTSFTGSMPNMNITREQLASFAAGFAGPEGMVELERNAARNCTFTDIAQADATLVGQIRAACEFGMMRGANGMFMPKNEVTRAEVVTTIVRAKYGMLDESMTPWYQNYMDRAEQDGIITQRRPDDSVTRYEAFLMYFRADGSPRFDGTDTGTNIGQEILCAIDPTLPNCPDEGTTPTNPNPNPDTGTDEDDEDDTVVTQGDIQFSLSPNTPAAQDIPSNAQSVQFLTFDVRPTRDTNVTQFEFELGGLAATTDFGDFYLTVGGQPVSRERRINRDGEIIISGDWDFDAGTTTSITLVGEMDAAGRNPAPNFSLVSVTSNANREIGLPVRGNTMQVRSYEVGSLTFTPRGVATTVNVGDTQAIVGEFQLEQDSGDSTRDVIVDSIRLRNRGGQDLEDLDNITLYYNNRVESTSALVDGDYVTFFFDGFTIRDGGRANFAIRADIAAGEDGDEIRFVLDEARDISAREQGTAFTIEIDDTDSDLEEYTIDAGRFNLTSTLGFDASRKEVARGASDVEVLSATVALDQAVEVRDIRVFITPTFDAGFTSTGTASEIARINQSIRRVRLVRNGDTVIDTATTVEEFTGTPYGFFYDMIGTTINPGDVLTVEVDINNNAQIGDRFEFFLNNNGQNDGDSLGFRDVEYVSDGEIVTEENMTGVVQSRGGVEIADAGEDLVIVRVDGYSAGEVFIAGQPNALLTEMIISNSDVSSLDIRQFVVEFDLDNGLTVNDFNNLALYEMNGNNGTRVSEFGQMRTSTSALDGIVTFTNVDVVLQPGEEIRLALGTDILADAEGDITVYPHGTDGGNSVFIDANGDDIVFAGSADPYLYVTPQLEVVENAELLIDVSAQSPRESIVVAGAESVLVGEWEFSPEYGAIRLDRLMFANLLPTANAYNNNAANLNTAADARITQLRLQVNGRDVGSLGTLQNGLLTMRNINTTIDQGEDATIRVFADFNSISNATETNASVKLQLIDVEAQTAATSLDIEEVIVGNIAHNVDEGTGAAGGDLASSQDTRTEIQYARATSITMSTVSPQTINDLVVVNNKELYEVRFVADNAGSADLGQIAFNVSLGGLATANNYRLRIGNGSTSQFVTDGAGTPITATPVAGRVEFDLSGVNPNDRRIATTGTNYILVADVTAAPDGSSISVNIQDDITAAGPATLADAVFATSNVVWSDRSSTGPGVASWFNGYLVPGLPVTSTTRRNNN